MADFIAADPERLLAGGIDMAEVSRIIRQLMDEIDQTTYAKFYTANGEDQLTRLLDKEYQPSAEECRDFMRMLTDLVLHYGQSVVTSGRVLDGAGQVAVDVATGKRG